VLQGNDEHDQGRVFISPDNRWLIAESENRMLRWDFSLDSLMDRADRIAGRELTSQETKKYALE